MWKVGMYVVSVNTLFIRSDLPPTSFDMQTLFPS